MTRSLLRPPSPRSTALATIALLALAAAPVLLANDLPTTKPEAVGLSTERLERMDEVFQGYIDREEAAGALALIARKGQIAYFQTWGDQDREAGIPMAEDTIFRIYSMSKPITGVALMTLYEEGEFFLDDPVGMYIPELMDMEVMTEVVSDVGQVEVVRRKARRPMTIRDLLRHTSGMTYGFFGNTEVDKQYRQQGILLTDPDLETMVGKLAETPLLYDPGTKWHYSVSVDVQGYLVEVLSGMSFDRFLKERIFDPLGMVDTSFTVPKSKLDRFAQLYAPKGAQYGADAFLTTERTKEIVVGDPQTSAGYEEGSTLFSGGGGLVSTAADYWRFCQMVLNGGELDGQRILSRKTVELMSRDHLGDIPMGFGRKGVGFGLGFQVVTDVAANGELGSEGVLSWGGAAGTAFWIDPKEELIGVFMVQILPHFTRMGGEFKQLTYQAIDD